MATRTTDESSSGTVAEVQEKGAELVSAAQQQVAAKAGEVREDAAYQLREQVEQRSTQAGEQVQAVGEALRSGVEQLRSKGNTSSAELVDDVARRADQLGGYLRSADADRILGVVEDFARRRPWVTAGVAAFAGFAASRFVKASSDRRYAMSRGRLSPPYAPTGDGVGASR